MHYQIENNLVTITTALADLLTGKRKVHVEAPYTDNDLIIGVVDKDFEVE